MKQYLITGYDYTDAGALQRRMNVRPYHIDGLRVLKQKSNYLMGGSILNDDSKMIGSTMIMQFETEEELEAWKQAEPYITQKVWESVDIKLFRVATVE